mgnify:CR=1 FL=1
MPSPSVRLYGPTIGAASFCRVTAGIRAALDELGHLAGVVPIDEIYRAPTTQTTKGELYLVVKTDAGTCTIARVRLNWADEA